jgi:hypothetical protein
LVGLHLPFIYDKIGLEFSCSFFAGIVVLACSAYPYDMVTHRKLFILLFWFGCNNQGLPLNLVEDTFRVLLFFSFGSSMKSC